MTVIRGCLAAVIRRFGKYRNVNLVGRFGMYSPNAPCTAKVAPGSPIRNRRSHRSRPAPWISLPRRRPCCRQMISSAAWKTAIAALGATPHATTKPSEFLSAQLLSTATAAAPCQQIPDPDMLVGGLLFAVTGLVEIGDSSFNRPSRPFTRPTVQTLDRRPNLHGITTWNRRRAFAAM